MKKIEIQIKDTTLNKILNYCLQKNKSPDSSINEIIDWFFKQDNLYCDFVIDESKEIWKDVLGYETKYQVSSYGRIKSIGHGYPKTLSLLENSAGYNAIQFYQKTGSKRFLIHRLVALAFLPNPENKPAVNHINGKKKDNRLENLEWVTLSDNILHSYRISPSHKEKIKVNSRRIEITNEETNEVKTYGSLCEAAEAIKVCKGNLSALCNGRWGVKKLKKKYTAKFISTF